MVAVSTVQPYTKSKIPMYFKMYTLNEKMQRRDLFDMKSNASKYI